MDHRRSYSLERLLSLTPLLAAVAGLLAWSVLEERRLGLWDDVTHLVDLSGRFLDGQTPYVDFLEVNPPASVLIYVPPTEVARLLGLPVDLMTEIFVFVGAGMSVAFCVRLTNDSDTARNLGQVGLLTAVAALFVLPAGAFAQRDHIALIAALPMLVVMGIRASGNGVGALSAVVAGLGGGVMVVIRPYYAAALALPAVYVTWQRGLRSTALFPELYAAGLVGVAYLFTVLLFFPSFLTDVMPMVMATYSSLKEDFHFLLASPTGLIWATLAALALTFRNEVAASPFATVAALASTGAFWSYLYQAKGFPYHGYVALALAFVAVALAFPKLVRANSLAPVALGIGFCIAILAESATGGWSIAMLATILVSALIALAVTLLPERMAAFRRVPWWIGPFGVLFVAFGQAKAWHRSEWLETPPFLAEAKTLDHPKIAIVAPNMKFVERLADRVGRRWNQHVYALGVTNGVDYLLGHKAVDDAMRQKLEAFRQRELDLFLLDIVHEEPDAIVVDEKWAKAHLAEPTAHAILRGYRIDSTVGGDSSVPDPLPLLQFYVRDK